MAQAQCRHCREEVPFQARFCPQCGEPRAVGETSPSTPADDVRAVTQTTQIGPTYARSYGRRAAEMRPPRASNPNDRGASSGARKEAAYATSGPGERQDNATIALPRGDFGKRNRTLLLTIPLCLLAAVAVVGLVMPRQPDASREREVIHATGSAAAASAAARPGAAVASGDAIGKRAAKPPPLPSWALTEAAILERSARPGRGGTAKPSVKTTFKQRKRSAGEGQPSRRRASSARAEIMTASGSKHPATPHTVLPLSTTPSPWREDGTKGATPEGAPMSSLDMGKVLYEKGEDRRAESAFLAARRETPADPDAIMGLGMVALRRGRYQEAQIHFREAIRIAPRRASYHVWLGHALLGGEVPALAAVAYQEALVIEPGSASAKEGLRIALTQSAGH